MKNFHSLLPVQAQIGLMAADKSNLDEAIRRVMFAYPYCYHTEESLNNRVFFDQPRGAIGNARFINPAPMMPSL